MYCQPRLQPKACRFLELQQYGLVDTLLALQIAADSILLVRWYTACSRGTPLSRLSTLGFQADSQYSMADIIHE